MQQSLEIYPQGEPEGKWYFHYSRYSRFGLYFLLEWWKIQKTHISQSWCLSVRHMEKIWFLVSSHLRKHLLVNGSLCQAERINSSWDNPPWKEHHFLSTGFILPLYGHAGYFTYDLGITSKRVRLIVGRYCRLYEMSE